MKSTIFSVPTSCSTSLSSTCSLGLYSSCLMLNMCPLVSITSTRFGMAVRVGISGTVGVGVGGTSGGISTGIGAGGAGGGGGSVVGAGGGGGGGGGGCTTGGLGSVIVLLTGAGLFLLGVLGAGLGFGALGTDRGGLPVICLATLAACCAGIGLDILGAPWVGALFSCICIPLLCRVATCLLPSLAADCALSFSVLPVRIAIVYYTTVEYLCPS